MQEVAGHTVYSIGGFSPCYILDLKEWGESFFCAAKAYDESDELIAIITEPLDRAADHDDWDFGEEERFQTALREVLRGLDYGAQKLSKIEVWIDGEYREIGAKQ